MLQQYFITQKQTLSSINYSLLVLEQGRSKHLETGPDVNTVKLHPLIN